MQALSQGRVLLPPLARLQGMRAAHVGPGSGTWTIPVSPWTRGLVGLLDICAFVETALTGVTITAAPPGHDVVPRTLVINYFRPARPRAGNLLARGRVVNSSSLFACSEAEIEDPEGRQLAQATGQFAIRRVDPPPSPPPSRLPPVEEPVYASPDPYLRREMSPEVSRDDWERHDGLSVMRKYRDGTVTMPFSELYGMRFLEVDKGRAVTTFAASEWFGLFSREVAPGVIAAVANATWWGAALTLLQPGDSFAALDQVVRFHREVPADGRALRVEARTVVESRNLSLTEASVFDADGVLVASESGAGAFIGIDRRRGRPQVETKRVLATLLFADIVGSTDHADRLGDARWRTLLEEYRVAVRHEIVRFEGVEIDTAGDGFFVRFDTPRNAIDCARAIRSGVKQLGIETRSGIHTGECEMQGRGLTGIAVHVGARIQGVAGPGEIWVSGTVRDIAAGSHLHFEDRGEHSLKGIPTPLRLYALSE
jgi:class 3 adenylate cyclase